MGRRRRQFTEVWDGKVFYCGHWRSLSSVEKRLKKMRDAYRERHPLINVYELKVRAVCPIHAELIDVYDVTIRTPALIEVEKILEWFKRYENRQIFQEVLTQESAVGLGVSVEVVGMHAGVKVTCAAP